MDPAEKLLSRSLRFGYSLSDRGCVCALLPQLTQEEWNDYVAVGDKNRTGGSRIDGQVAMILELMTGPLLGLYLIPSYFAFPSL